MHLLEHEAVGDPSENGGGEVEVPVVEETAVETPVVEEAPALSFDDPAFFEAVAAVVDARQPAAATPAAAEGETPDWNEYLNPLGDNYGQNLSEYLAGRDKWLLAQIDERFKPVTTRAQAEEQAANDAAYDKVVATHIATAGLPVTAAPIVKSLAAQNYENLAKQYGESRRTADLAMSEAIKTVNALATEARTGGVASNVDQLAEIAAAAGEPGTGGGAVNVPAPSGTPRDLFNRRFGLVPAA